MEAGKKEEGGDVGGSRDGEGREGRRVKKGGEREGGSEGGREGREGGRKGEREWVREQGTEGGTEGGRAGGRRKVGIRELAGRKVGGERRKDG